MISIEEIRKLKESLEEHYSGLRREQETDQQFYDDKFPVNITGPYHVVRTGSAARIVDNLVDHITTSNPRVSRDPKKKSQTAQESARKVTILLNSWVEKLVEQIEEAVKNGGLRGEGYFQLDFNPDDKFMPITITAPDPYIVYADPHEVNGIPARVIKWHKMTVGAVRTLYPEWRPQGDKKSTDEVEYLAYFDSKWRYFEADGIPLLKGGIQKNLFGFVPFVHFASGFGKTSAEGKPETKYVGRLRKIRGRLKEECEIESRLDSIIGLWANPIMVLKPTIEDATLPPPNSIDLSPGHVITLDYGWDYEIRQGTPPPPEMFHHQARIQGALGLEAPPVTLGVPSTASASGRQEDIYSFHFKRKPDKLQKNVERALAIALGLCLRAIETIPGLLPIDIRTVEFVDGQTIRKEETVTKEDIDGFYECKVEFKPDEELEQGRKLMMFRALHDSPSGPKVSWKTLLTEGLGWPEEKAEEEIDETLAETAIRTNPLLANIAVEEAMEGLGLQRYLNELKSQGQELMTTGLAPIRSGQPRAFTGNPESRDVVRQMLMQEAGGTVRKPPPSTGGGL
jgi:hypothetical protein